MNMARLSPPRAPCDKSPVAPHHFIGRLHISRRIENRRDVMRFNKMLVLGTTAVGLCLPKSGVLAKTTSEERRVGKVCVRTCRSRWARQHEIKKTKKKDKY